MTETPAEVANVLFERFVMHDFADKPRYERQLQARVKETLKQLQLAQPFKQQKISKNGFYVTFPLPQKVEDQCRVIQPLSFISDTPKQLNNHGNNWISKLDTLQDMGALPDDILIPVESPKSKNKDFKRAWDRVQRKLSQFGELVPASNKSKIVAFAKS